MAAFRYGMARLKANVVMDKRLVLLTANPYAFVKKMEVDLKDSQIDFRVPGGEIFRLDNVGEAEKLRNMLDVWIAYRKLLIE
jgi:hypothetical protein